MEVEVEVKVEVSKRSNCLIQTKHTQKKNLNAKLRAGWLNDETCFSNTTLGKNHGFII